MVILFNYRDMGFLPDAFINYLVRLGWSHGDQEYFTRDELIEKFSLENIGRSAGIFDQEKLLALNAEHIKATPIKTLARLLTPFLKAEGVESTEGAFIESIVETLVPRSKTLQEMARDAVFYYADTIEYEEKAAKKFLKTKALEPLTMLVAELKQIEIFTQENLEDAFRAVMEKSGLKLGKIAQPVRVALTGRTASPGIFEIITIIGKEKVLARLNQSIEFIHNKPE